MTIFAIESQKKEILHIFLSKCIVSMVKTIKYSPKAAKILEITLKFPHCRKFYPKLTIFYTSTHLWCLWQISSLSPWPTPSPPICNRRQAEVPLWRRGLAKKTIGSCSLVKLSLKSSSSSSWSSSSSFSCSSSSSSSSYTHHHHQTDLHGMALLTAEMTFGQFFLCRELAADWTAAAASSKSSSTPEPTCKSSHQIEIWIAPLSWSKRL